MGWTNACAGQKPTQTWTDWVWFCHLYLPTQTWTGWVWFCHLYLWLKEVDKKIKYFQKIANTQTRNNCIETLPVGFEIFGDKELPLKEKMS